MTQNRVDTRMLGKAASLLIRDRKLFWWKLKVKCLHYWCSLFRNSALYVQGKMDIDPKALWHNRDFVSATGGYQIPGDRVHRAVLNLEPWDTVRRDMLILLLRKIVERQVAGDIAELGVYKGNTARLIHHYVPERKLHLFDTFSGFDQRDVSQERERTGLAADQKAFSDTSIELVLRNVQARNDNVEVHPGFFPQSVPEPLKEREFAFVHLDADLYDPIMAGLEFFYPRSPQGGIIVVHDYNSWPGARRAVDLFFQDKPETPIPMPDKSGSVVIVKLAC
jgi:O-methyltransferase